MKTAPLTPRALACAIMSAAWLGGCASFSPDGGFDAIRCATQAHVQKDVAWERDDTSRSDAQARVDALLEKPLSADAAVQIALLNNPRLQAAFNSLRIAEADWVAARRLPNPRVSIGRFTRGSEVEWERSLHLDLVRLLMLPLRAGIEQRLFEQTRRGLVLDVPRLAAGTRRAWVVAVAADQSTQYQQLALDAAEAGAELARRMAQAGNWSALKQARERLARLTGLPSGDKLQLPERLPDLPASLPHTTTPTWRTSSPAAAAKSSGNSTVPAASSSPAWSPATTRPACAAP